MCVCVRCVHLYGLYNWCERRIFRLIVSHDGWKKYSSIAFYCFAYFYCCISSSAVFHLRFNEFERSHLDECVEREWHCHWNVHTWKQWCCRLIDNSLRTIIARACVITPAIQIAATALCCYYYCYYCFRFTFVDSAQLTSSSAWSR